MTYEQLKNLLDSMTLDEKIAQLYQTVPYFIVSEERSEITGPMQEIHLDDIPEEILFNCGTMLGGTGAELVLKTQEVALKRNTHKIPFIFMADIIHGFRTIFPIPLALSCSWDMELAERSAEIAALESAVSGVNVTFSPMVDLLRDPRWGRCMESTGEDPYLNSLYAAAFVKGYQGDDISKFGKIAACVKHFAAYGAAEAGRDYNTVDMSTRTLREYYLPSYKAAVDAGVAMVMTSFNTVEGIPATGNKWLFQDLLRDEWGFKGTAISDWGAVNELIAHGIAKDGKEAAEKALIAGVDIEMMTTEYLHHLKDLVNEGTIKESLIDESVMRILELKQALNLFDKPLKDASIEDEAKYILCDEHRADARKIAGQSMVLLKNENILPFPKNAKIALIGPHAANRRIMGGWSGEGKVEDVITLEAGFTSKIGKDNLLVCEGCTCEGAETDFSEAVKVASQADYIVLAIGEDEGQSGEAASRTNIKIPGAQEAMVKAILELKKPTAVVLFNGRPLDITDLSDYAPAILEGWFLGTEAGNAVADVVFGDVNPTGKLTMSFPVTVGQVPIYYNHYNTGRPAPHGDDVHFYSRYLDCPRDPMYPFGYGLSYTTYEYSNLKQSSDKLTDSTCINVSVDVKNTGKIDGDEIVQLYIRDISGSTVRPVIELKGFKKVYIKANETKTVTFEINEKMLRYYNASLVFASEKGDFDVFIGANSRDNLKSKFELV